MSETRFKDALHVIGIQASDGGTAPADRLFELEILRMSTEACRDILDSVSDGVYKIGPDGYFTYLNRTVLERSGLTRENFHQCHYLDLIVPEQREFVRARFERVMRGEENPPYDLRTRGRDGREYVMEVKSRPIFENGRVAGMLGISRDVTVRRKAEETILNAKSLLEHMVEERTKALRVKSTQLEQEIERRKIVAEKLRESESRYQVIFESTGTAMMIVGEDATIHLVNAEFEKLSGYSRKEAEGALRWTDLLSDADIRPPSFPPADRRGTGPVTVKHYECQAVDRYGQVRDIYATAAEIPGTQDRVVSLLDITEPKRAMDMIGKREAELAAQNRELTDLNTALKVLLKKREEDRREMEERVADNIRDLVLPHLAKLRKRHPGARERSLLNLIESNLKIVISPSTPKLSARLLKFTPKEIQVANLIKAGRTTKEIAEHLDVSKSAIDTHRHHIRNKLGLKKKKVNLRSYLHSLD